MPAVAGASSTPVAEPRKLLLLAVMSPVEVMAPVETAWEKDTLVGVIRTSPAAEATPLGRKRTFPVPPGASVMSAEPPT